MIIRCAYVRAASKHSIDTGAGVIDADYRGPVKVLLFNHSDTDFESQLPLSLIWYPKLILRLVKVGDRVAQLILERVAMVPLMEADVCAHSDERDEASC